ncbi:PcfJ domain-containing protein [Aeoliella sp.]|uniref:PcfJ domain-containing protein n=1 Tax=Aeoliella sp. TaxID=2795800 RepID=UPI003CCBF17D
MMDSTVSLTDLSFRTRPGSFRIEARGLPVVEVALQETGFSVRRVIDEYRQRRLFSHCGFGCLADCDCQPRCNCADAAGETTDCRGECNRCFDAMAPEYWFPYLGPSLVCVRDVAWNIAWAAFGPEVRPDSKSVLELSKLLRGPVAEQTKRLLRKASHTVLAIQKTAFHTAMEVSSLFKDTRLYQHPYLEKDLLTYPAAATVLAIAPRALWKQGVIDVTNRCRADLQGLVLQHAQNWRAVLSPSGRSYRSLSRTLVQLPGRVPLYLLPHLAEVELERPVVDRVELIALLEAACYLHDLRPLHAELVEAPQSPNLRVFKHAKRAELTQAMQSVAMALGCELSSRRAENIGAMARYLMAYPEPHYGRIGGLTRKSIAWHRAGARDRLVELHSQHEEYFDTATTLPSIDLPKSSHLTFLRTAGDVYQEGNRMKHCVAQLANKAIAGSCYLFHCNYDGCHATIEVDQSGRIIEARGPFNQHNLAVDYGTRSLEVWGSKLRK